MFSQTGDVDIIIRAGGREQRYLLHRLILAQCSAFFEAGTSQEWSRQAGQELTVVHEGDGARRTMGDRRMRWRYELDAGNGDDDMPMLIQRNPATTMFGGEDAGVAGSRLSALPPPPPSTRNKPSPPQAGFFRTMANFSAMHLPPSSSARQPETENETLRDYDNLFRTFYNHPPNLDTLDIVKAYVQCKGLLNLADMYDALDVVGPRVDHHLLQFQGRLWKQIAKYPPSYLKVGYLARSKVIFAEALVHVVGQWPAGAALVRAQLPEPVLDVIEDKVDELEDLKTQVERKLFRLTLTTTRGERVTPANAYLAWTAVSLFRQWLAENTTPVSLHKETQPAFVPPPVPTSTGHHHSSTSRSHHHHHHNNSNRSQARLPPPPVPPQPVPSLQQQQQQQQSQAAAPPIDVGRVYRLLGAGGSAYLNRDELKRFLKLRPDDYNRETVRRFEARMDEIKDLAREIVRPLMRNCLGLDLGKDGGSLGYLTCTKVEERDFPWEDGDQQHLVR
ncbi:MAG: hypothetical protein M1823_003119 [Watsoniomyces obsoletus]|nr:MAG: hypothetical protein M1823_003119 [Watsoniomyces obsoletus]